MCFELNTIGILLPQEVDALRRQLGTNVNVEVDAAPGLNLGEIMNEMRQKYEVLAQKNLQEAKEQFEKQVILKCEQMGCTVLRDRAYCFVFFFSFSSLPFSFPSSSLSFSGLPSPLLCLSLLIFLILGTLERSPAARSHREHRGAERDRASSHGAETHLPEPGDRAAVSPQHGEPLWPPVPGLVRADQGLCSELWKHRLL